MKLGACPNAADQAARGEKVREREEKEWVKDVMEDVVAASGC